MELLFSQICSSIFLKLGKEGERTHGMQDYMKTKATQISSIEEINNSSEFIKLKESQIDSAEMDYKEMKRRLHKIRRRLLQDLTKERPMK